MTDTQASPTRRNGTGRSLADYRAEFMAVERTTYLISASLGPMPRAPRAGAQAWLDT
jgi:hypothetical protein